jgi:hypothetical protein
MSLRKLKVETGAGTISHVFAAASTAAGKAPVAAKAAIESKSDLYLPKKLTSSDSRVQAFYDSLKPAEIVAHSIAVEKLGTSYDVTRTHGFLRWCKANNVSK